LVGRGRGAARAAADVDEADVVDLADSNMFLLEVRDDAPAQLARDVVLAARRCADLQAQQSGGRRERFDAQYARAILQCRRPRGVGAKSCGDFVETGECGVTVTSTKTCAQSRLKFATVLRSELGIDTNAPCGSRTTVRRSVMCSTRPVVLPARIVSPTANCSSKTMKKPLIKSWTRFCAPKPMARLARPAAAASGVTLKPISGKAISAAITKMTAFPPL
jgi:hypothetical protein